ncbi:bacteriocin biosynthesis protein SagD [Halobacteriales archaeon QS_8_69_26]|nr:MAG: bacteriocin biosynthesis protein SagD [Halobacteriales archaeon QS_8_69_26]
MDVRLAGGDPAIDAVEAALSDARADLGTAVRPARVAPGRVGGADLAVAAGAVGDGTLPTANENAREAGTPLVGIEVGGVGGHPVAGVEASVAGFVPDAGCFECLRSRVAANDLETNDDPSTRSAARLAGAITGREALKLLAGQPSRLLSATGEGGRVAGVIELPQAERRFLPVPGCACDPGEDRHLELAARSVDLETALERAELAVDERVGLVSGVGEVESFPAPYYLANVADTTGFSDARAAEQAAGVDPDWNRAFMKALGEGMERYAAGVYRTASFETGSPAAVDGVSPADFVRPDGTPEVDPDEPIPWAPATDLRDGSGTLLPAEAVQFPPPEKRYLAPITTGLGLGSSTVEAVTSGLTEVIERDATMIAWYSTFDPLALRVDDEGFEALARRARSEDLSVTALLVTVDVDVPVVTVAVHREGDWPRFAVGADADLDPTAAARDALAEALQNWMELRSMGPEEAAEESTAIGEYADFPEEARDLVDAGDPVPAGTVAEGGAEDLEGREELDAIVDRVAEAGLAPYAARVTTRDVAAAGFEAVRVRVPSAQPLFVDRPAFGDRAREVPADLGFEPALDRRTHPYP